VCALRATSNRSRCCLLFASSRALSEEPATEGVPANRLDQVACEVEGPGAVPCGSVRLDWLLYIAAVQNAADPSGIKKMIVGFDLWLCDAAVQAIDVGTNDLDYSIAVGRGRRRFRRRSPRPCRSARNRRATPARPTWRARRGEPLPDRRACAARPRPVVRG